MFKNLLWIANMMNHPAYMLVRQAWYDIDETWFKSHRKYKRQIVKLFKRDEAELIITTSVYRSGKIAQIIRHFKKWSNTLSRKLSKMIDYTLKYIKQQFYNYIVEFKRKIFKVSK